MPAWMTAHTTMNTHGGTATRVMPMSSAVSGLTANASEPGMLASTNGMPA